MALITNCPKKGEFKWTKNADRSFEEIKKKLITALVFCLPDFSKVLEVACDTLGIGIGGMLILEDHLVAYFSEKLNKV